MIASNQVFLFATLTAQSGGKAPRFRMRGPTSWGCFPNTPLKLLEKSVVPKKEAYWRRSFMLGTFVLAPRGIPVSSGASPRPMGRAVGLVDLNGLIGAGVSLVLV